MSFQMYRLFVLPWYRRVENWSAHQLRTAGLVMSR